MTKDIASDMANLASARLPKYAARILFLRVIAYILGWNRVILPRNVDKHGVPQHDEDVRRNQEKHDQGHLEIVRGKAAV